MTTRKLALWAGLLALGLASSAQATLESRLGGLAYYDSTANLTWMANANAAGLMTWSAANTWAAGLSIDGVTGWRLPTTTQPDSTCSGQATVSGYPNQGEGYNCTGSEMGNLFYNVLGGTAGVRISLIHNKSNYALFSNIFDSNYWSATAYAPIHASYAWSFIFGNGDQGFTSNTHSFRAWAVHSGDVAAGVPEPGTLGFMGAGLLGLLGVSKRKGQGKK